MKRIALALLLCATPAFAQDVTTDPPPPPAQRSALSVYRDATGSADASITVYASSDSYCSLVGTGRDMNEAVAVSKAIIKLEAALRLARAELDAIRQQLLFEEATP